MGYTSYWYFTKKEIDQKLWDNFLKDFKKILPNFEEMLDHKTDQKLNVSSDEIFFNGKGDLAHETFWLQRISDDRNIIDYDDSENKGKYFAFCKTARKPYDIAVSSTLIIAKKHFGDLIDVSSDGNNEDEEWIIAKQLCQQELGYGNLDMGDPYEDEDGKWHLRNPKTLGKLLDKEIKN